MIATSLSSKFHSVLEPKSVIALYTAACRLTIFWCSLIHSAFVFPKTCYLLKLSELNFMFMYVAAIVCNHFITQST
jgi:hypothetical protein